MLPSDELSIDRYNLDRFCFEVINDERKHNSTSTTKDKLWEKRVLKATEVNHNT